MLTRLARLSRSELPVASTSRLPCPACHRSSSSLSFPVPPLPASSQKQRASSWAALSLAGSSLFAPTAHGTAKRVEEASFVALAEELKRATPDSQRAWKLFSQLDLQGGTHRLKLGTYAQLVRALHEAPPKIISIHTTLERAKQYTTKIDLVRLRMRQAGHTDDSVVQRAILKQYATLHYGPGVCKIWDEMLEQGRVPPVQSCTTVFGTLERWIQLHHNSGGRVAAKAAAAPLVPKAIAMMEEMGTTQKTNAVMDYFFEIVRSAEDFPVFSLAMKRVYGFNIELPGAAVEGTQEVMAGRRRFGEQQLLWVLGMLDVEDDLSSMIAVFEVADAPPPPTTTPGFFGSSFTPISSTTATTALHSDDSSLFPHPVGTRAFSTIIMAAARLKQGGIVRHYFRQLSLRWEHASKAKLAVIENAVGIIHTKSAPPSVEMLEGVVGDAIESGANVGANVATLDSASVVEIDNSNIDTATASPPPTLEPESSNTPLTTYPTPERDYQVPSHLVHFVLRAAKNNYDAPTAHYIRIRTRHILYLMEQYIERNLAVAERLTPALRSAPVDSIDSPAVETAAETIAPTSSVSTEALDALAHDVALYEFHRLQLRFMLGRIKAESNIVNAYACLRRLVADLRRLEAKHVAKKGAELNKIKALGTTLRRKALAVSRARRLVLQQRLSALYLEGKAHEGVELWRNVMAQLAELDRETTKWVPIDRALRRFKVEEVVEEVAKEEEMEQK